METHHFQLLEQRFYPGMKTNGRIWAAGEISNESWRKSDRQTQHQESNKQTDGGQPAEQGRVTGERTAKLKLYHKKNIEIIDTLNTPVATCGTRQETDGKHCCWDHKDLATFRTTWFNHLWSHYYPLWMLQYSAYTIMKPLFPPPHERLYIFSNVIVGTILIYFRWKLLCETLLLWRSMTWATDTLKIASQTNYYNHQVNTKWLTTPPHPQHCSTNLPIIPAAPW